MIIYKKIEKAPSRELDLSAKTTCCVYDKYGRKILDGDDYLVNITQKECEKRKIYHE